MHQVDGGTNGFVHITSETGTASEIMKSEVKHLERSTDRHGKNRVSERKAGEEGEEPQDDWSAKYALCIIHQLDNRDSTKERVLHRELQVNSKYLTKLMKDVIVNYPGNPCASRTPTFTTLPYGARCLFFYRKELQEEGLSRFYGDEKALAHLKLLMDFIEEEFEAAISSWEDLVPQGLVDFHNLWTIFCPGSLIVGNYFGHPCVSELQTTQILVKDGGREFFQINAQYIDYDGEKFGFVNRSMAIPRFEGFVRITALGAYPLAFDSNEAVVRQAMITRGKRFETFAGQHCQRYEGVAIEQGQCTRRFHIPDTLVMIDHKTFNRSQPDRAVHARHMVKKSSKGDQDVNRSIPLEGSEGQGTEPVDRSEPLTEEEQLLTSPMVRGFSFSEKRWVEFALDQLRPVHWNKDCFKQLVLQESHKDLVRALVSQHTARVEGPGFDDIVKGKGKGLVLVLHGPPGTGKTLTAEAVAEWVQKPLYVVSAGDLGTDPETLEDTLKEILDLASTWRAVLLIDEADVFLERRSLHDIQRNSLVSIFLRVLEYYEGILFLTSNRVSSFDDAMKSRIHMPLKYNDLDHESRKAVWKNFLVNNNDCEIDEDGFNELSKAELNGRQIKNIIKTARSLATYNKEKLEVNKLKQVVDIQMQFERQLSTMGGANGF